MKSLDRSRPFGTTVGMVEYKYEQDGKRFDAQGNCMDEPGYKAPSGKRPAHDVATTTTADPAILEQVAKQAGGQADGVEVDPNAQQQAHSSTELETLGLSAKVMAALRGSEIDSVEALARCTASQIEALPNIGRTSVDAIKKALKKAGKKLAS